MLTAIATGALGGVLGGSGQAFGAGLYVFITVAALFLPAGIAVQVITGQALVASLLLRQDGPDPLLLVPVVAGVVATAELLAVVARLDTPLTRDPTDAAARAGRSAAIGGGVFGAVMLVSGLPGPAGPVAVVLASAACVVVAVLFQDSAGVRP